MNLDIFKNTYYRVFGTRSDKELKRIRPLVNRINAFESEMQGLTDDALKAYTATFKEQLEWKDCRRHPSGGVCCCP